MRAHLIPAISRVRFTCYASRVVLEPLADLDINGNLVPVLAAEPLPSLENGMVLPDGLSVTWKLRQDVKWHDGTPFTARDVKFTFDYLSNPETAATTFGTYEPVDSVEVIDEYTVKVNFKQPWAGWFVIFTGPNGMILPEHALKDYVGAKAKDAPFNLQPIGTGPYKVKSFTPGDVVVYEINQDYWEPGKPFFDTITLKGGGDAASAARAVLQTGEMDYAWNIQVEPTILKQMEAAGLGKIQSTFGGGTERIEIMHADPQTEVNGEKAHYTVPHPHFKELKVRQALALAIQRDVIAEQLYGPGGSATALTLNENKQFMPQDLTWEFNLEKAAQLLDEVGAAPGPDGIRVLNGRRMDWLWMTSINAVRQKTQEIVKAALAQIGINIQIKAVDAAVFFSGDPGNPDTLNRGEYDLGMWTNSSGLFPIIWYKRYLSRNPETDIAQRSNDWHTPNVIRYQNDEFNRLYTQVEQEIDPDKYTALFLDMQRLVVNDVAEIGIIARNSVAVVSNRLTGINPTPYASDLWDVKNWRREG
uniref:Peptide ABC transporter substrate-binding protein n=1 Tax=Thermorudis sp. TaxID=1969470 RepID=A0A7C3ARC4_9BACT